MNEYEIFTDYLLMSFSYSVFLFSTLIAIMYIIDNRENVVYRKAIPKIVFFLSSFIPMAVSYDTMKKFIYVFADGNPFSYGLLSFTATVAGITLAIYVLFLYFLVVDAVILRVASFFIREDAEGL